MDMLVAWSQGLDQITVRLLVASVLGGLIGLERELYGRPAGLRTQLLVGLGAALAMVVSLHFAEAFGSGIAGDAVRVDPARLAYGVMTGVGFLGAGEIIHSRRGVQGLTTAASLWCTAAVGLAAGFGLFVPAAIATAVALFALRGLHTLDRFLPQRTDRRIIVTTREPTTEKIDRWHRRIEEFKVRVTDLRVQQRVQDDRVRLTFFVRMSSNVTVEELARLTKDCQEGEAISIYTGQIT